MENKENVSCVADEVAAIAERAFAEGLASSIMAGFPVAGIIAIFKGIKGLKLATRPEIWQTSTAYLPTARTLRHACWPSAALQVGHMPL